MPAPPAWAVGKGYVRGGSVRLGNLVVVARSDGTSMGKVAQTRCVWDLDGGGRPDKVSVELGANLFRPAAAGAAGAEAALGVWEQLEAAIAAAIRVSSPVARTVLRLLTQRFYYAGE